MIAVQLGVTHTFYSVNLARTAVLEGLLLINSTTTCRSAENGKDLAPLSDGIP